VCEIVTRQMYLVHFEQCLAQTYAIYADSFTCMLTVVTHQMWCCVLYLECVILLSSLSDNPRMSTTSAVTIATKPCYMRSSTLLMYILLATS
jgi:hypothetical protein